MIASTRREFLAAAGGVLAATGSESGSGSGPSEHEARITLLAEGFADWKNVAIGAPWDYFQRSVPAAKAPAIPIAAEMIYWQRPGGGRVFRSGSINSGMALAADPKWSGLLKNVLAHFGVPRP